MIGCLRTSVRKQPIIALYFEHLPSSLLVIHKLLIWMKTETRHQTLALINSSALIGCLRTRVRKQPFIAFYFEYSCHTQIMDMDENRDQTSDLSPDRFISIDWLLADTCPQAAIHCALF